MHVLSRIISLGDITWLPEKYEVDDHTPENVESWYQALCKHMFIKLNTTMSNDPAKGILQPTTSTENLQVVGQLELLFFRSQGGAEAMGPIPNIIATKRGWEEALRRVLVKLRGGDMRLQDAYGPKK